MSRKTPRPAPPIRVGSKAVTYTPPGPRGAAVYGRLIYRCEIIALRLDDEPVSEMDAEQSYDRRDLRADLRLPDDSEVLNVPYHDQTLREPGDGSSWCRPWISSMTVR
jgi:hypothetical protein